MQIAKIGAKNYMLLPGGILLVDPEPDLLAAHSQLLIAAGEYVAASGGRCNSALCTAEVSVAILSETLGAGTLEMLAQQIRRNWPNAVILLFGNTKVTLSSWSYDDAINVYCRPEELLSLLHLLQQRSESKATQNPPRIASIPYGLLGRGWMLRRSAPHEDDSLEDVATVSEELPLDRDLPADEHARRSAALSNVAMSGPVFEQKTLVARSR